MKEVRVAGVGLGGIFIGGHLPAYARIPEARLVALSDPSEFALRRALKRIKEIFPERIAELKEEGLDDEAERLKDIMESIRVYRDYNQMLEREEIDLVDVCTPHKYHKPIAIDALRAGVNVMVEKPMSRTYIEALEIVETVKETGRIFQLNENYIFAGGFYKTRKLIEMGELGELEYLIVPCSHEGPEGSEWYWDPWMSGGGSLVDIGSHAVAVAWFLVGFDKRPMVVKAEKFTGITLRARSRYISGSFRNIEVEDDAHVLIKFQDEKDGSWTTALIEGAWSGAEFECTTLFGSRGSLKVRGKEERAVIEIEDYLGAKRTVEVPQLVSGMDTFTYEIRNMCKCILRRTRSFLNEDIGAEVMAMIDAAYYSEIKHRKAITIEEFKKIAQKLMKEHGKKASEKFIEMKIKNLYQK